MGLLAIIGSFKIVGKTAFSFTGSFFAGRTGASLTSSELLETRDFGLIVATLTVLTFSVFILTFFGDFETVFSFSFSFLTFSFLTFSTVSLITFSTVSLIGLVSSSTTLRTF